MTALRLTLLEDTDLAGMKAYEQYMDDVMELLPAMLDLSSDYLVQESQETVDRVNQNINIYAGIAYPLAIIGVAILSWVSQGMRKDSFVVSRLLSMLPYTLIARTPELKRYIKHGTIAQQLLADTKGDAVKFARRGSAYAEGSDTDPSGIPTGRDKMAGIDSAADSQPQYGRNADDDDDDETTPQVRSDPVVAGARASPSNIRFTLEVDGSASP